MSQTEFGTGRQLRYKMHRSFVFRPSEDISSAFFIFYLSCIFFDDFPLFTPLLFLVFFVLTLLVLNLLLFCCRELCWLWLRWVKSSEWATPFLITFSVRRCEEGGWFEVRGSVLVTGWPLDHWRWVNTFSVILYGIVSSTTLRSG